MKAIFLFPGQGTQYPEMGLDLIQASSEAKKVFAIASAVLGRDMASLIRNSDADTLKRTDISQNAISTVSLAAAACLKEQGIFPAACAGFSLGEYPALCCAGVISPDDCFRLTDSRGKAMQAAIDRLQAGSGESKAPGMAAVIGLAPEQVEALIAQWKNEGLADLYTANINSQKQVVVSGSAAALEEAEKRFKKAGARRVLRLAVAGPFHSPFMKEAAEAFALTLDKVQFNDPSIPLFSNVTGNQIKSGAEAKTLALRQITEKVRWTDEEAAMAGLEPKTMLEVGPGKVLQGLWRDTGSEIPCFSAGTFTEINELK
ncbi:MAG: ACP S-malonyltransferase [Treponema sp.]|nr:ACP S-malonyltransferase [Treponema sp.]